MSRNLNVAIEGCCHGELDLIYDTIRDIGNSGVKVDLLLVCGDFQCVRNAADLQSLAVPHKYRQLKNFHEYVSGKKVAPVVTIFIGGNHEASNILQSLYYGGWVAPNIYYLGFGGVVWFGGIRIAGLSGIYNGRHYRLGHYENPPYTDDALRSVYHVRETEVYRMAHINVSAYPIDVFLSHDWPGGVWEYGDKARLLSRKSFLQEDMLSGKLGSPPLMDILRLLRPTLWFAAHLHVKFAAIIPHTGGGAPSSSSETTQQKQAGSSDSHSAGGAYCHPVGGASTRFLSLDKCLPGRDFLQVVSVPPQYEENTSEPFYISYDAEWLAIMRKTHHLLSTSRTTVSVPSTVQPVTPEEILQATQLMKAANRGSLVIPPLLPNPLPIPNNTGVLTDPQTDFFLNALGLPHIWTRPSGLTPQYGDTDIIPEVAVFIDRKNDSDPNQLSISDDEADEEQGGENTKKNLKSISAVDPNEIAFDDDDDDWTSASVSASELCSSTPHATGVPGKGYLGAGIIFKIPTSSKCVSDVISFEDDIQIAPSGSTSSPFGLKLPPPKAP